MKKFRAILCIVLALSMVLVFAACAKDGGSTDSGTKTDTSTDSGSKTDSGSSSSTPADSGKTDTTTPEESSAPVEVPADIPQDQLPDPNIQSTALHMFASLDEYFNRPHEIVPGSSIHLLATNDVPSQLPWNATAEVWLLPNIYEGLAWTYMGQTSDVRPLIAESYTVSEDYLTWTFQIRDGIKFADGTVCDAPAVAKSWSIFKETSPASFSNVNVESFEATSDKEFVVHLSAPCSYFEISLQTLYVLSPTALEQYGPNDNRAAIGTGPYYINSYTAGVEFTFKANPDYYYYDRMPVIENVTCSIINDATTKLMAMVNGDIDGYAFSAIESYYYLTEHDFNGTMLMSQGNCSPNFLNAKTVPEFCFHEVREAMSRFIDWDAINGLMYDNMGLVQTSLWSVGSSGEVPFDGYHYNEAEGLELMAKAGVDPKSMNFPVKIIDSSGDLFVTIQGQLNKVGIQIEVQPLEPEANFTFMMNGDWTITAGNSGYSDARPYLAWTFILLPEHLIKECWQDVYDPELYEKMKDEYYAMTSAPTWDEMMVHCKQLTVYEQEDYGALNGIQAPYFAAFAPYVKDVVIITENHSVLWYYLYLAD